MAAVFLMQPLGQLAAHLVGLFVVLGVGRARGLPALTAPEDHDAAAAIVDSIWRCVIGVGAFPALVAIIFRLTIPESPRFTLDVEYDANRALLDTQTYYKSRESVDFQDNAVEELGTLRNPALTQADADGRESITESLSVHSARAHSISLGPHQLKPHHASQFSREDIHQYFWVEGNWRHLAGTSLCWFFLDFAFYGLGINNPRVIAKIWTSSPLPLNANSTPAWGSDYSLQDGSIYDILKQNAIQSIITVSIGSVLGSLILIKAINYIPRKSILAWSFLGLAALLAITGGTFFKAFHSNLHALTITFYVLCQLLFNLGRLSYLSSIFSLASETPLLSSMHTNNSGTQILIEDPTNPSPFSLRPQYSHLHPPCRDLSHALPLHLPRYRCCGGEIRLGARTGVSPSRRLQRRGRQLPQFQRPRLGSRNLLRLYGVRGRLCLGLDSKCAECKDCGGFSITE